MSVTAYVLLSFDPGIVHCAIILFKQAVYRKPRDRVGSIDLVG
jgi:hypothetical protein